MLYRSLNKNITLTSQFCEKDVYKIIIKCKLFELCCYFSINTLVHLVGKPQKADQKILICV